MRPSVYDDNPPPPLFDWERVNVSEKLEPTAVVPVAPLVTPPRLLGPSSTAASWQNKVGGTKVEKRKHIALC